MTHTFSIRLLAIILIAFGCASTACKAEEGGKKIRVLFVGGDWKAQLPNFQGKTPLRGFFVKHEVEKAAPGRFEFTLWTSYEFLQYGDSHSLKEFDVLVVGDVMGQSVLPRLVKGLTDFVSGGGGLMYCDNHKAFMFYTKENSYDPVLPIEVVPFRAYGPDPSQPSCNERPLNVKPAAADHPIMKGLDFATAPALGGAHYGTPKPGATVLATSPAGKPIWVAWEKGKGRAFWAGGVFSNDELSGEFSKWPQFGKFYVQALEWLAAKSSYPAVALKSATAEGMLSIDITRPGPAASPKHFGIHGQEDAPGGSHPMKGADLELYKALNLDGTFARTSAFMTGNSTPAVVADLERIKAEPVFLYWCDWGKLKNMPNASVEEYTNLFAASIERVNGKPGTPGYKPRLEYFEIMNEPSLGPAPEVFNKYMDFYNTAVESLRPRYPGVKFGCGGFNEWTYVQGIIDRCGKNLDWFSRHPYGHTGEAVFYLHDQYAAHAREKGFKDMKFIITEWDFWIYGAPAFDYCMSRWKPVLDHADSCLGTLHYRWREYQEGGYVFGIHGEFNNRYGELPPEWPNPGQDKPITYRYNAWWIMRDCRGPQLPAELKVPSLAASESTHAYAVATCNGSQFNIVVNYGYPVDDLAQGVSYKKLKLHISAPIPPQVKGRSLSISRTDCKERKEEAAQPIIGDKIDMDIEVLAQSAVSLTVK